MAIATNDTILKYGTADVISVGTGTAAVLTGAYSAPADTITWTNTDDAERAAFVLKFQYPSGTITTAGIVLFAQLLNIDGTIDEPVPSANWSGHWLGAFGTGTGMVAVTDYAINVGPVQLPSTKSQQEYVFSVLDNCGVTMSAGWTLTVVPVADGPV
jgi:hypothetical protein